MHVENLLSQYGSFLHNSVENIATIATRMDESENDKVQKEFCESLDSILHD